MQTLHGIIRKILLTYYNNDVFSAASVAVFKASPAGGRQVVVNLGQLGCENSAEVDDSTLFDLASLTKPLVTLLCILVLIDQQKLDWNTRLADILENAVSKPLADVDIKSLLSHCAGLAAHREYWTDLLAVDGNRRRDWLLGALLAEKQQYTPGSMHVYSDLGYMLLGYVIERLTGKKLDVFWGESVSEPAALQEQLFFPGISPDAGLPYPMTGTCEWSGVPLTGVVNDNNCRALGGVAGHAGLFGTSSAVLTLCQAILALANGSDTRLNISRNNLLAALLPVSNGDWTAGFTVPAETGSSSGRLFAPDSIGHLGFTGTSFWIDRQQGLIVVLLTNRVLKGGSLEGIRALRPHLHDEIVTFFTER